MKSFTFKFDDSFDSKVYLFIYSKCDKNKNEYVIQEYQDSNQRIKYDLYLPNGCKALEISPKTGIELKVRISYNTIERCVNLYNIALNEDKLNDFFVIYGSAPKYDKDYSNSFTKENVKFFSYNHFKSKAKRVNYPSLQKKLTWKEEQDTAIKKANNLFHLGKNTLFLGAGVSSSAGLPSWDTLLHSMIEQYSQNENSEFNSEKLDRDCDNSSIIKGRYIKMLYNNNDHAFVASIKNALTVSTKDSLLVKNIGKVIKNKKINQIITYNYDDLIENELYLEGMDFTSISKSERLIGNSLPIYHVHGYIPIIREGIKYNPYDVRLSEDSYHEIYKDSYHWSNVIQLYALNNSTCFFIGLSMKDPNLRRLLDISTKRGDESIYHFAFLKRDEFTQHKLTENIFREMEVQIIWYEKYDELPDLINKISQ